MKKENVLLKGIIALSSVALLFICGFFAVSVFLSENATKEEKQVLTAEVEYVREEAKLAPADDTEEKDGRKVIKIVEVVPHQICMAFPYLVDWGTIEDYNKNLHIGYEGMRYLMFRNADGTITQDTKSRITRDGEPENMDTLYDYNVVFTKYNPYYMGNNIEQYWRRYENVNINNVNGYFEYVGEGKGLYDINLNSVVEEGDTFAYGIRYRMTAMDRKKTGQPGGEYTVNNPVCYLAKDYHGGANLGFTIEQTEYNYDLSFACATDGNYRIYRTVSKDSSSQPLDFEYDVYLAEGFTWQGGYEFRKNGNYQVSSVVGNTKAHWGTTNGLYIRVESTKNIDNVSGVAPGYFKLYDSNVDGELDDTTMMYMLTFGKEEDGSYVLSCADVKNAIEAKSVSDGVNTYDAYAKLLFEYVGTGNGNYDVSFIYAPEDSSTYKGAKYTDELEAVCFQGGRYALAKRKVSGEALYISGAGDYSKLVSSIDCRGIDYDTWSEGRTSDAGAPAGLSMGITEHSNNEKGAWVFHTVPSDENNGITKADQLSKTKIYVYGQNRKKCYYSHWRFSNNEWFKLLIYLSNDANTEPLAWQDYQNSSLTAKQIKEKYREDIEEFDKTYRIEIVQRTPGELTPEEVDEATLLYFSERVGLEGIQNYWNEISTRFNRDLDYLPTVQNGYISYTDDLRSDTLMAIYQYCMYDQTTAIMLDMDRLRNSCITNSRYVKNNLGKMLMMLDLLGHPSEFAYFIEGYEEHEAEPYKELYSEIDAESAVVTAYENKGDTYNLGKVYYRWHTGDQNAGEEIEPTVTDVWDTFFFRIPNPQWNSNGYYEYNTGNVAAVNGWKSGFPLGWGTIYQQDVKDDWTWYGPNYATGVFNQYSPILNIWKIIHNRKAKERTEPVIIVTNADGERMPQMETELPIYYFYVDAYSVDANEDFKVDFKVNWAPEEISSPTPLSTLAVTREDTSPVYNVAGPQYNPTEYSVNVSGDFTADGILDAGITEKDYKITAADEAGKFDEVIVRFVIREAFMLN